MNTKAKTADFETKEASHKDTASMSKRARDTIKDGVASVQETHDMAREHLTETVDTLTTQSTKFVRENPAIALAGAVGVGIVIGLAAKSKS